MLVVGGVGILVSGVIWNQVPLEWQLVIIGKTGMDPDACYDNFC